MTITSSAPPMGMSATRESVLRCRRELFALLFPHIVHSLGNLIGNVQGRAEMLLYRSTADEDAKRYLSLMLKKTAAMSITLNTWMEWLEDTLPSGADAVAIGSALGRFAAPLQDKLERHNLTWQPVTLPDVCSASCYLAVEELVSATLIVAVQAPPPWRATLRITFPEPRRVALVISPQAGGEDRTNGAATREPPADYLESLAVALSARFADPSVRIEFDGTTLTVQRELPLE